MNASCLSVHLEQSSFTFELEFYCCWIYLENGILDDRLLDEELCEHSDLLCLYNYLQCM